MEREYGAAYSPLFPAAYALGQSGEWSSTHSRSIWPCLEAPGTTFPCSKALNHALCDHAQFIGPFACLVLRREPSRGTDDSCTGSRRSSDETCGCSEAC